MRDYLRENASCLRIPKSSKEKIGRYQNYCKAYYLECGRWPSIWETADYMGLSVEQVEELRDYSHREKLESLDNPVTNNEGEQENTIADFIPDERDMESYVIERIEYMRMNSILWGCVDALPGKAPDVIRQRYQEEKTYMEIGKDIGISWNEVRNIHDKALRKLRRPETSDRLRHYLPEVEQAYIMGLQGGGAERFHQTRTSSTERAALELYQRSGSKE